MNDLAEKPKGLIAWFAGNHVAANLLMLLIVVGGLISMRTIRMEISPDMSVDIIMVTVPYLGASPVEVEEGVCVRVEEAIEGIEGIKRLTSTASEGFGSIVIENSFFEGCQGLRPLRMSRKSPLGKTKNDSDGVVQ